jgi:site-specific recombinase XerD
MTLTKLEPITVHQMCHTFASLLVQENVPIPDITRVIGHARASTTIDLYGR